MFNLRAGLDFCAEPVTAAAQSQSMRAGLNACRTGSIRDSYTDISPRSHRF
ncbi:hypothetical protein JJJ17_05935 [Paracoccus caeni]|uniref:Uncharacterized protein n=2 Tax=Paracoccus caeni TaxID=657651 RepID=A0A934VZM6_9RHOB|nr:hypothetical protein [Paracoccus caeni]